jgi:fucose permease
LLSISDNANRLFQMRINWFVLGLTYFTLFVFGLADNSRGPIFPDLIAQYGLTDAEGSFFFFTTSGFALFSSLFGSTWLKRLGAYQTLQAFSVIQGLGLVFMGFAPSYAMMLVGCAMFGASAGALGISQNLLVSESVPAHRRRQALSGLHCMYGVSSLLAPLLVTTLYGLGVQWRQVFAWVAAGSLLAVVISFKRRQRASVDVKLEDPEAKADRSDGAGHPWGKIIYLGLILSFYVIAEIAISSRLVLFSRRECGLDVTQANLLLSLFFLLLFIGRLVFAIVNVPLRNPLLLKISAFSSLVCFSLGILHDPAWLSLCGLTMSMFYPCMMAFLAEEMGSEIGFATAWCVTIQSFGLMLMHFSLGRMSDLVGLRVALWMGPVCLALILVFFAFKGRIRVFRRS